MGEIEISKKLRRREAIFKLEGKLKELPQQELGLVHHFCKGLYARELRIPKDTLLTGKIHKHECLNFLMKGSILLFTEDGDSRVTAPAIIKSEPGVKRVGRALEDCIWVTAHPNPDNTTSTSELEEALTTNSYAELEGGDNESVNELCSNR